MFPATRKSFPSGRGISISSEEKRAAERAKQNARTEGKLTPEQRAKFQRSQGVRP